MKKIPLTLITWFLGSGKTTLINKILKENKGLKIALIVNEFWDVALESQFIQSTNEEIVEMSNWCMCCVVRKDIIETVENLLEKRPDTDYIIVEASWLSDPVPIAETFAMNLTDKIRLDAVLCVVDWLNISKNFWNYDIASKQILYSDIVLVSKTNLISSQEYQEIKFFIKKFNPFMRIFKIDESLELKAILDTNKFDYSKIEELEKKEEHHCDDEHCDHEHHHHEHIDEVFVKTTKPLNMEKFSLFIKNLDENIVRWKGFIYPNWEDYKWKKMLFQYVWVRIDTEFSDWDSCETKQTAIVFIWKWFDKEKVKKGILNCES